MSDTIADIANHIIGELLAQDKYKFASADLIAEVVRDTIRLANEKQNMKNELKQKTV